MRKVISIPLWEWNPNTVAMIKRKMGIPESERVYSLPPTGHLAPPNTPRAWTRKTRFRTEDKDDQWHQFVSTWMHEFRAAYKKKTGTKSAGSFWSSV